MGNATNRPTAAVMLFTIIVAAGNTVYPRRKVVNIVSSASMLMATTLMSGLT